MNGVKKTRPSIKAETWLPDAAKIDGKSLNQGIRPQLQQNGQKGLFPSKSTKASPLY